MLWKRHCRFQRKHNKSIIIHILSCSSPASSILSVSVSVLVHQGWHYVWWTSWNMSSRGMGVSAPYILEARRSKAETICFTTSSKKTWASWEWRRERNSKAIWEGDKRLKLAAEFHTAYVGTCVCFSAFEADPMTNTMYRTAVTPSLWQWTCDHKKSKCSITVFLWAYFIVGVYILRTFHFCFQKKSLKR